MKTLISFLVISLLAVSLWQCATEKGSVVTKSIINPPIKGLTIKNEQFKIKAETGDVVVYKTGSVINIPANAFKNSKGELVKGEVDVTYREFHDPVDLFLSGIPMGYDSAGKAMQFETAGMFEINATQNGEQLYANAKSSIEIAMRSFNDTKEFNIYYLDTVANQWKYIEPSAKIAVDKTQLDLPESPIQPVIASTSAYIFTINADYNAYPELSAFKEFSFQVDTEDSATYNTRYANELWFDVSLKRLNDEGKYMITFVRFSDTVSFNVRPVVDAKNLKKAMTVFSKQFDKYAKALTKRIEGQQQLMYKRQVELAAMNKKYLDNIVKEEIAMKQAEENEKAWKESFEKEQKIAKLQATEELIKYGMMVNTSTRKPSSKNRYTNEMRTYLYRVITVQQFGISNSDCPQSLPPHVIASPTYKDKQGNVLTPAQLFVVDLDKRISYSYYTPVSQYNIEPTHKHKIWFVVDGDKIAYADIPAKTVSDLNSYLTVEFNVFDNKKNSEDELREILSLNAPL